MYDFNKYFSLKTKLREAIGNKDLQLARKIQADIYTLGIPRTIAYRWFKLKDKISDLKKDITHLENSDKPSLGYLSILEEELKKAENFLKRLEARR
jgi:hypothetical protein